MKGGVVLVFIILLQLAMADVWGDLWKKVQVTANDESTRVLEKVCLTDKIITKPSFRRNMNRYRSFINNHS